MNKLVMRSNTKGSSRRYHILQAFVVSPAGKFIYLATLIYIALPSFLHPTYVCHQIKYFYIYSKFESSPRVQIKPMKNKIEYKSLPLIFKP